MSKDALSQTEIDALLAGAGDSYGIGIDDDRPMMGGGQTVGTVNTGDLATLLELINFILQRQTDHLTALFQREISFSNVKAKIKDNNQVRSQLLGKLIQIRMNYSTGVVGDNIYILKVQDALHLVELFTKQSNVELSDIAINSLGEGFVHMMTTTNTAISEKLGRVLRAEPPQIEILDDSSMIRFPDESQVVHISYTLTPEDGVAINLSQVISIGLAKELINLAKTAVIESGSLLESSSQNVELMGSSGDAFGFGPLSTSIRPIRYSELIQVKPGEALAKNNIGLLLDISMQLTVELGRTKMQIKKILALGEGSIIELEKLAGEPVDLLVNGKLIAKGEVVVIDENFGVRITEIVSPHERLESIVSD